MAGNKVKFFMIGVIVLLVIAFLSSVGLFYSLQKEHAAAMELQQQNTALQQQLGDIKTEQEKTKSKLDDANKMISAFEIKLKDTQDQIDVLTTDLKTELAAKQEAMDEAAQLKTVLEQQKSLRSELENRLMQMQDEAEQSHVQLNELQSKKAGLETKIKELEAKSSDLEAKMKKIELGTIVVAPAANQPEEKTMKAVKEKKDTKKEVKKETKKEEKKEARNGEKKEVKKEEKKNKVISAPKERVTKPEVVSAPKAEAKKTIPASVSKELEGMVLVINKEYNFAVINLGSNEGAEVGDIFSVYHAGKYAGDVKVEKVHNSVSAAGFVSDDIKDKVNEGDKVIRKK
ncbi:MAG: hypothetical protein V2A64_02585 [Candidatus Omnitrophota bacterium]